MKRILITGSRGFVGRALYSNLSSDYEIYGLDIQREDEPDQRYIGCDITDYDQITTKLSPYEFDVVIHCAAIAHANRDTKPQDVFTVNTEGTKNLVQFFSSRGQLERFVLFSTVAVYGEKDYEDLVTEKDALCPVTVYGQSKVLAEKALMASRLPWTVFRFAPIYDAGFMKDVLKRVNPLGNAIRFRIGDGFQRTSFCSIGTVVDVIRFSLPETEKMKNRVFNVADLGDGYSIRELLDLANQLNGRALTLYIPRCVFRATIKIVSMVLPGSRNELESIYWKLAEDNLYSTKSLKDCGFTSTHNLRLMVSDVAAE